MSDVKRYDPFVRAGGKFDQMAESPLGSWVKWGDYVSATRSERVDKAGWIGMAGDQSARIKELEAEVSKLKEDRQLLAKTIESILPISIDEFSKGVLKKKGKKKHG